MNIDMTTVVQNAVSLLTQVGFKLVGAIILWIVGRFLIKIAVNLLGKAMDRQHVDTTIVSYIRSTISVTLTMALVVALLGFFGVETTTFAALLAGVGLAIGAAWSGLLANFASGVFLVILRPFKVGDFVTLAGVTGTVREIGLFGTALDTMDGIHTIIGNGKVLTENMQNFTLNPWRRVDLLAQLDSKVSPEEVIAALAAGLKTIPNVIEKPAPDVEILTFSFHGPVLAVRPYCHNDHYWQVYFDGNKLIQKILSEKGVEAPAVPFLTQVARA